MKYGDIPHFHFAFKMDLLDSDLQRWYIRRASLRGRAVAARRAHNPEVAGSSPAPATFDEP